MNELTPEERSGVVALLAARLATVCPIERTDTGILVARWTVREVGEADRTRGFVRVVPFFGNHGDDHVEVWVRHQTDEPVR